MPMYNGTAERERESERAHLNPWLRSFFPIHNIRAQCQNVTFGCVLFTKCISPLAVCVTAAAAATATIPAESSDSHSHEQHSHTPRQSTVAIWFFLGWLFFSFLLHSSARSRYFVRSLSTSRYVYSRRLCVFSFRSFNVHTWMAIVFVCASSLM